MPHRRTVVHRQPSPGLGVGYFEALLGVAAKQWVRDHPASTSPYLSTTNGFLVLAERAWFEAAYAEHDRRSPEVCPPSALRRWREDNRSRADRFRHCVYLFWTAEECLYVGVTSSIFNRLRSHESRFGPLTDRVEVELLASREKAEHRELELILSHLPTHNIAGKPAAL